MIEETKLIVTGLLSERLLPALSSNGTISITLGDV
jgi:hypothetical protein